MNALPAAVAQPSAFGTKELTTQLVLRLVDDEDKNCLLSREL